MIHKYPNAILTEDMKTKEEPNVVSGMHVAFQILRRHERICLCRHNHQEYRGQVKGPLLTFLWQGQLLHMKLLSQDVLTKTS